MSYAYDAWGNVVSQSYTDSSAYTNNPFRYRGYYWDSETGFYYLESRYYDPKTGRFLNADGYVNGNGDLIGYNLYAYCSNNPVLYADYEGESVIYIIAYLLVKKVVANKNYSNNSKITIEGVINDQEMTKDFRMGLRSSDKNGCGWIAAYNAMILLGNPQRPADVIKRFDASSLVFGFLGTNPLYISGYFKEKGYDVEFSSILTSRKTRESLAQNATVGILLYAHSSGMHYVTFQWTGTEYKILNGSPSTAESIEKYLNAGKARVFVGMWTIS